MSSLLLVLKIIAIILLFILFFVLIIIAALLFMPISYYFESKNKDKLYISLKLFVLFKMLGFYYFYNNGIGQSRLILFWKSFEFDKLFGPKRNDRIKKNKKASKHLKKDIINIIKEKYELFKGIVNKKEIFNQSIALIKKLIKALKNKYFKISVYFGLSEPDKTGIALGLGCIIKSMIPIEIELKPDFENECFEYNADMMGKTTIFFLIVPIINFILKKPVRNLIFKGKDE